jgi:glycosyltransferase involved in cell wall biosynthesis
VSFPTITVVIAVYNGAETIRRAIESVLAQTSAPHEVIIVDDGSTDETAMVVREFGDRVRYIYQSNAGVAAARNAGAAAAHGDWLAFLDADDWYYPDRIRLHAQWLSEDPDLDFLTGDFHYRDSTGAVIGGSLDKTPLGLALSARALEARAIMRVDELAEFCAQHVGDTHTLTVPRRKFEELGGYPIGYKVCEDVHFLIRLCAVSRRAGVVCRPLGAYVIHGNSATRADPLAAQRENIRTLLSLRNPSRRFPASVRKGYRARLRKARLNLGYSLLRAGERSAAFRAVLPVLVEKPRFDDLRAVLSVMKAITG